VAAQGELGNVMANEPSGSSDRDRQVNEIITTYLEAVDAGQAPDRQEWLRRYPQFAAELEAFLADYERVDRMAEPLRPAEKGTGPICRNGPEAGTDAQRWSSHQSDLSAFPPNEAATVDSGQPVPVGAGTTIRYFGDYELLEEIGRGGMGVVYKARQVSLNRVVALKMILAGQLASESDVRRFHTEAEAAAQLDHPGIVPIFEVGQHEGQHYFSMGYVEGQSLAVRVAAGPLPPREAAEVVQSVAEAVEYAHQKGVLHRDLKPANVLLDESRERRAESSEPARIGSARPGGSPLSALGSRPRITDFGLAKRMTAEAGPTTTGQILGTPSYMPPEQASGRLDEVGPASDVYGLGAVLYTLVTGRPPFQSANPLDTLRQVREAEPAAPRLLNAGIDRDLETIILKCLAKEPAGRYATARELSDDLARFLSGQTIRARPVGRSQRLWRWCRRNPVVAGLTAAVAVVLLAGAATSTFFALQANRRAGDAVREKDRADAKADEATANAREARQRLYISDMRLAQRAWEEGHLERLTELLDAHQPRHEQGNREHESSVGPADNPVRRHRGSASTADGRTYAWQLETKDERTGKFTVDRREYDLSKGTLLLVKTQGKTVQVLQLDRPLADVPFDVDGCRDYLQKQKEVLAFLETGGLQIQELESGENLFRVAGQTAFVFKYSGSPVHFWIELDSDGNKQRHEVADLPFLFLEPPAPKQVLEGYFVWVRGEADDAGREMWRLGFQKSLVSEESSIIRDISPVVQAHGTQSKTTRDTSTTSLYPTVQVWKGSLFRRIRG
jgi:serine/threonine protein kinase